MAICDDFISKSMPEISYFSKKRVNLYQKWSKGEVDFGPLSLKDCGVVLAPKWLNFTIPKGFW